MAKVPISVQAGFTAVLQALIGPERMMPCAPLPVAAQTAPVVTSTLPFVVPSRLARMVPDALLALAVVGAMFIVPPRFQSPLRTLVLSLSTPDDRSPTTLTVELVSSVMLPLKTPVPVR